MSKLLEHEVKSLLTELGVAVPVGILLDATGEHGSIAGSQAGPFYVKAQIAAGDRAKAGGVVRVDDLSSAREAGNRMLGTEIRSSVVESVLIEQGVTGAWEGYAAVTVAENPPRRVLVFCTEGGAGFDPSTAPFQLTLTEGPQAYRIRRELRRIGVTSEQLPAVTRFLERLAECAVLWCAYTLETNPVTFADGAVVALDAKADLDDYSKALIPRPELLDRRGSLRYVQLIAESHGRVGSTAQVASHSVGGGESMVVLDALAAAGLTATNYCDTSGSPSAQKVATGAALVAGQPHIDGLLFSTCIANQALSVTAAGLVAGWEQVGWRGPTVVRVAGNQAAQAREIVRVWAEERGVPIVIVGEETDEWQSASALSELLERVAAS